MKMDKAFSFRGALPLTPGPRWGLHPRPPFRIAALAMVCPLPFGKSGSAAVTIRFFYTV